MRVIMMFLLIVHGAIHLMGFVKGFGIREISTLTLPISRQAGAVWLLASLSLIATAVLYGFSPSRAGWLGLPALMLSQTLIVLWWKDASFGTAANVLLLIPLLYPMLEARSGSLSSLYAQESAQRKAEQAAEARAVITETDVASLPSLLQIYLRRSGAVGRHTVKGFRARFHGRFRNGFDAPWMAFESDQHNFLEPSARYFTMTAKKLGIPLTGLHRFDQRGARMQIRAASIIPLVDASGPKMDRSETVTLFNDVCLLAPSALLDLPVSWTTLDSRTLRGVYSRGEQTISALLSFDEQGDLVNFVSEDRFLSADGKLYQRLPWSTPIKTFATYDGFRLPSSAEAVWTKPEGDFTYGEFNLAEIIYF